MKCSSCDAVISQITVQDIKGTSSDRKREFQCIAYTCPHCSHVLSVQMNPLALNADILDGVESLLQKHLKP